MSSVVLHLYISIKIFQHYYKYLTLGRMLIYCMDEIWRLKYGDLVTWWDINILSGQYVLCYIIFIFYYSNMYNTNINSAKFYIMLNKLVNTEQHTTEHILWTMGDTFGLSPYPPRKSFYTESRWSLLSRTSAGRTRRRSSSPPWCRTSIILL